MKAEAQKTDSSVQKSEERSVSEARPAPRFRTRVRAGNRPMSMYSRPLSGYYT